MFSLKIALRFLKNKIFQFIVVVFIIAIGTSVFYFILLATSRLNEYITNDTLKEFSDINYTGLIEHDKQQIEEFRQELFSINENIIDVSAFNMAQATFNEVTYHIKGVNFEHAGNINDLDHLRTYHPNNKTPQDGPFDGYDLEVLVGVSLARRTRSNYLEDPEEAIGRIIDMTINGEQYSAKIVGYFMGANLVLNSQFLFTTATTVEKLNNIPYLTGLDINIKNTFKSRSVLNEIDEFVTSKYPNITGSVWQDHNKMINDMFILEETSVYIIQFFTAVTISFSLATIIFLNTRRRLRQIGILKALGLNQKRTSNIFLIQFILYTVIGITLGLFLGNVYSYFFSKIVVDSLGRQILDMPYNFFNRHALITVLVIGSSLVLANLYPLLVTRNLKIVDIIKSE